MASGHTEDMKLFDRINRWRPITERETYPRDRSLRGKARRKARKEQQRAQRKA